MDASGLREFLDSISVGVPGGSETIRMFKPGSDWISSDYRLSSPSLLRQRDEQLVECPLNSLRMLAYPMTQSILEQAGLAGALTDGLLPDENPMHPLVHVSWDEAIGICNKISSLCGLEPCCTLDRETGEWTWHQDARGFRLPTEAEWQHACKAGSDRYQYGKIDDIAWHLANSNGVAHPVGLKQPNALGLYDMLGNVWEWCWDTFDPATHPDYRVFKGGSYAEEPRVCGATTRRKSFRTLRMDDLGFRIVRKSIY